jgi:hypothetical protein
MKILPLVATLAWTSAALAVEPVIWKLDQTARVGGHATEVWGAPRVVNEPAGASVWFNGSSDGLFLPVNPLARSAPFTIEVLFYPEEGGLPAQRFFHLQDDQSWRVMLETRLDGKGGWWLDTFLGATGVSQPLIDPTRVHPTNQWCWVALRFDGKHMTSFVNGVQELEREATFGPMVEGKLSLGVRQNKVHWFKGGIREVRWHRAALKAEELQKL